MKTAKDVRTFSEKERHILAAATKVLTERGYRGTTISRIVDEAGVARGLLHYYFKTKDELLESVLALSAAKELEFLAGVFDCCTTAGEFAAVLTRTLKQLYRSNPDFNALIIIGAASGRHKPEIRDRMGENLAGFRAAFEKKLARLADHGEVHSGMTPREIALALTALLDGFGIQLTLLGETHMNPGIWESLEKSVRLLLTGHLRI